MPIHEEVLRTAQRLCKERRGWELTADEIVRALPHLNTASVRTHVTSRCCVNAPKHHPHKWDYFRRVGRGRYELEPRYRRPKTAATKTPDRVAEAGQLYAYTPPLSDSIHAKVTRGETAFVAECLEVALVTQGRTLDEVVANLEDAVALHLEEEDPTRLGLSPAPRLVITIERTPFGGAAT